MGARIKFAALRAAVTSALLISGLAAGCRPSPSATAEAGGGGIAARGSGPPMVWRVGNGAEPEDLDPHAITGVTESRIARALFEPLATENPVTLDPEPALAERWTIADNGLTYTFHLRPGLKWSDGSPMTADDLVQSYRRLLTPSMASEYHYLVSDYVVGAKEFHDGRLSDFGQVGFAAPDDRTLVVRLKQPVPYLLRIIASHYAWTPVPVKAIGRHGPIDRRRTGWTRAGNIVSSGPFVLKQWLPDQKIVVERNPHYWDAASVKLDAIEFHAITDGTVEERLFRTGQLDMTYEMPMARIEEYRRDHPDELSIGPYLGIYYYQFNVARPPLNDPRVRRALSLTVDRGRITQAIMRGGELPALAVSYPGTAGYTPRAALQGDLAEAKRLLAEAGFPEGRGFPTLELLYNTSERHRPVAEAVQEMWRRHLGIEVRLTNQEWGVYLDSLERHDFSIARSGWIADYLDPNAFLEIWRTGNGNNHTNWSSPEYDRLYAQALAAPDQTARYAIYQRLDEILVQEMPIIPIFHYTRVRLMSPRVKGFPPNPLDSYPYKHVWLETR